VTEIEELVRRALAETPTATSTTDPLATLDRRVRRARRWLAAGAVGVAAAVVAAVVVPIAVLGGNGAPNSVGVARPTPTPSVSNPPGVTTYVTSGARWVGTAPADDPWGLVNSGEGNYYVTQVGGGVNGQAEVVSGPANYVVPGIGVAWVVGSDATSSTSRVSAVTAAGVVTRVFDSATLGSGVVVDHSLYVRTGAAVERMDVSNDAIEVSATIPVASIGEVAASQKGHVWVQSGTNKLVELLPTATGMKTGVTVEWTGDIYGPTGRDSSGDDLWAYDGDRLIGLTPSNLQAGVSVAEGWRITVAGRPTAVATDTNGGLFVAVNKGIYYYPPKDVQGSGMITEQPLAVSGVTSMAADPNGGIDYVDDHGQLSRWDPTASAATR
jgi:hypothetical protein